MDGSREVVAAYGAGSLRPHELQEVLQQTWLDLVRNPASREEIATLFRLAPTDVERIAQVPLVIEQPRSGMGGLEIAVIVATWVGTEVLLGSLKDLGKEVVKDALRKFWTDIVSPALRKKAPERGALGLEKALDEDV